jgi:hypothetical protein
MTIDKVFKDLVTRCNIENHKEIIEDYISKFEPAHIPINLGSDIISKKLLEKRKEFLNPVKRFKLNPIVNRDIFLFILRYIATIELYSTENHMWLIDYISGSYDIKNRYFHNMPLDIEEYLNKYARYYGNECFETSCIKRNVKSLTLYRGMSFDTYEKLRFWLIDEVVRLDDNNIVLNINKYTSWTSDINITQMFSRNTFGVVFSYKFTPSEYKNIWNTSFLNEDECEFFVKPGTLKCKVEDIYKDSSLVDSFSEWDKLEVAAPKRFLLDYF